MSLKHYVQMAYKDIGLSQETELRAIQSLNGTLQSGSENLLLVYAGSFNPPHQGHISAILSGLRPEIAAVGIVILPSEDWYLRNKVANSHPDFFLPQRRRADLLGAIPSIPKARVWVWTTTWYPFKLFTEALLRLTKADGFNLAIARLVGPDNLNTRNPLKIMPYEFPAVVITNRARHFPDHFLPDGKPVMWDGFGEWTRSKRGGGDGSHNWEASKVEVVLWTCTGACDSDPPKKGYYLQYLKPVSTDISSTNLRQALVQTHQLNEARLNRLSTEALLELLGPILQGS